jgi:hypothetical protein
MMEEWRGGTGRVRNEQQLCNAVDRCLGKQSMNLHSFTANDDRTGVSVGLECSVMAWKRKQ